MLCLLAFVQALPTLNTPPVVAQSSQASGFKVTAPVTKYRSNGVRWEGNAKEPVRFQSPELDVTALAVALDLRNGEPHEVRAIQNVHFKVKLAQKGSAPARIEARCDQATLELTTRTLRLRGNVNGWYQVGNGPKNTISGNSATLRYVQGNVLAEVEGGTEGVRVVIPAEPSGEETSIGTVEIMARRATVDQKNGALRFIGNPRAVSNDRPNKLDISVPSERGEFIVMRGANGTIDTLKTSGRTLLKIDLPPESAGGAANNAGNNAESTATAGRIGQPTHLEIEADVVTMTRANNTIVFERNVKGFYRLARAGAPAQDYNFSDAERAVVKYVTKAEATAENPAGPNIVITGKPVSIELPGFDLGLSD